ncbi:DNA integrity scanning protein DisA nucleotide-binding domain protein, partial [Flavobacteriales bacterium]|nr:DNA integrity scanning protein DisA nucleotide-binding domain protein [Flavobacteriales bacterium]
GESMLPEWLGVIDQTVDNTTTKKLMLFCAFTDDLVKENILRKSKNAAWLVNTDAYRFVFEMIEPIILFNSNFNLSCSAGGASYTIEGTKGKYYFVSNEWEGKLIKNKGIFKFNFKVVHENNLNTSAIAKACEDMAKTKTGSIMVITQMDDLAVFAETGVAMNAEISVPMIESIFYKNSPLHDGAVIIRDNKIISARCVLPVSNSDDFPGNLGMRHRAAVGITEESDAVTVIVSEETGGISYVKDGELFTRRTAQQLEQFLNRIFT